MNDLKSSETYMQQCFDLAEKGKGMVSPNPMVGCVIVKNETVIGEGYHRAFGQNHAEVNAIESVKNREELKGSELYVNLEPCVHQGKTPPCCDRIIESGIRKVVIAGSDPNVKVNGRGVEKLQAAGIDVISEVLSERESYLNRRFRTYHQKKRPYIILKWAQTQDGFMDILRNNGERGSFAISSQTSRTLAHKWRAEEDAIMVGTNTVLVDDPSLTVRLAQGKNPLRIIIDRHRNIPATSKVLSDGNPSIVYTENRGSNAGSSLFVEVRSEQDLIPQILTDLCNREVQSVLVEGGSFLLNSLIKTGMWDEARVFTSANSIGDGLKAPILDIVSVKSEIIDTDKLDFFYKES